MTTFDTKLSGAIGGGVVATVECDCGESFRLQFTDADIDVMAHIQLVTMMRREGKTVEPWTPEMRVTMLAALGACHDFTLWVLTHATRHDEQQRRDASKGSEHVH